MGLFERQNATTVRSSCYLL